MPTGVNATNWPTRDKARDTIPRESTKGHNVASRRTYEARNRKATERSMDKLLERATRKFSRIDQTHANVVHMDAHDRASDKIADALHTHAVALLKKNA